MVAQGLFFVALAFVAVGYKIDRTWETALQRLGLVKPTLKGTAVAVGAAFAGFVISGVSSQLTRVTNSEYADSIERSLEVMTTSSPSLIAAPLIGLSAGFGEELLFRGALQPRYGLILTSLLFAMLHAQYGFSFITLGTFLLGYVLGIVAIRYGTTHAIIAHAIYNAAAVIISTSID
ncbi:MAG: CPBP family intramembrane metalloprotease [Chloroflexota bacterium]|nr:CPBP family intramembrane metalloprotease [Chloroflexota bacterium]